MSILYFSTCLQSEADKKDLLGLFVAEGGRVPFLCSAARQILQVKLPHQRQSCPEGTTPGTEADFLFFSLCSPLWICCAMGPGPLWHIGVGFMEQSTPSHHLQ